MCVPVKQEILIYKLPNELIKVAATSLVSVNKSKYVNSTIIFGHLRKNHEFKPAAI